MAEKRSWLKIRDDGLREIPRIPHMQQSRRRRGKSNTRLLVHHIFRAYQFRALLRLNQRHSVAFGWNPLTSISDRQSLAKLLRIADHPDCYACEVCRIRKNGLVAISLTMIERYELRLFAQYRDLVGDLLPAFSAVAGGIVVLRGEVGDAVFSRLAKVDGDLQKVGLAGTFAGWEIKRSYTQEELQHGELFLLKPPFTHLSAEEHGTLYTEPETCRQVSFDFQLIDPSGSQIRTVPRLVPCGLCSKQATPLHLPLSRLPRSRDLVMLWGGEIVLSERFCSLLTSRDYLGSQLRPIVGTGKKRSASKSNYRRGPCQLTIYSSPVEVSKECRFGANPFDSGLTGSHRCPSGEIAGLNLLSALKVVRSSWDGSDIARTKIYVGGRQGLFRPHQLLLVSKRLFHAMRGVAVKGFDYEVVELV